MPEPFISRGGIPVDRIVPIGPARAPARARANHAAHSSPCEPPGPPEVPVRSGRPTEGRLARIPGVLVSCGAWCPASTRHLVAGGAAGVELTTAGTR